MLNRLRNVTDDTFTLKDFNQQFRHYVLLDRKRKDMGLTPTELRRWMKLKRILNQEFSPADDFEGLERRESVRLPARVRASFRDVGEFQECLMMNLSRGGLFIATDSPLEIGASFELRITLEESGEDLDVPVEVVSHNARPDRATFEPGMGVRFCNLDDAMRAKVDHFYDGKLQEAGRAVRPVAEPVAQREASEAAPVGQKRRASA